MLEEKVSPYCLYNSCAQYNQYRVWLIYQLFGGITLVSEREDVGDQQLTL